MHILSRRTGHIRSLSFAVLVAVFATASNGMAQDITYGGQMTLNWTIDTFSCPTGFFCPGQQLVETVSTGSETIPLTATYSSCSVSPIGSGPVIVPLGPGAPDIVFVVPNSTGTCQFLFDPGPGAFWYDGDITTPDGSFAVLPPSQGVFLPPVGQFKILSQDPTNTFPTSLTFNAAGGDTLCDNPTLNNCSGFGYANNSWTFNGGLSACSVTYNGTVNGNLRISNGLTCIVNGTVTGNVTQNGGGLFASDATIGGNLRISGGTFSIANTVVNGNVAIQNIPAGSAQNEICATDVNGNLQFTDNGAAAAIGTTSASCPGNTIGGNLRVDRNSAAVEVSNNAAGGNLQCRSNASITGSGDTAASLRGQCAGF
jgi:hypothetical protein